MAKLSAHGESKLTLTKEYPADNGQSPYRVLFAFMEDGAVLRQIAIKFGTRYEGRWKVYWKPNPKNLLGPHQKLQTLLQSRGFS